MRRDRGPSSTPACSSSWPSASVCDRAGRGASGPSGWGRARELAVWHSSAVPAANIMTGIAGLVDVVADPLGTVARLRLVIEAFLLKRRWRERKPTDPLERFIVLCWRRTGSNWLCGVLHGHPEILMHNELFNESDIHTYHRKDLVVREMDLRAAGHPPGPISEGHVPQRRRSQGADADGGLQ
ncbi:hypothetical protein THAOC_11684, partial [Thalassiosira oceanica]